MSISKDIIKQSLISKQKEIDEDEIISRPIDFESNGDFVVSTSKDAVSMIDTTNLYYNGDFNDPYIQGYS